MRSTTAVEQSHSQKPMTTLSNKTMYFAVAVALFGVLLAPAVVSAAIETPLCGQGVILKRQLDKTIENSTAFYTRDNDNRTALFARKTKEQQLQVTKARVETDIAWKKYVKKLQASATTEEEKVAVQTFATRVENAREIQYRLDDASSREFVLGVGALLSERKSETLALSSSLKKDMSAVLDENSILCGEVAGTSSAREKLRTYQKSYAEKIQNRTTIDQKLQALQDEREVKRRASQQAFKAELREAFTNLQSVLH